MALQIVVQDLWVLLPVERQPAVEETHGQAKCPPHRQEMKEAEKRGLGPLPLPNHTFKLETEHLGDTSNPMTAASPDTGSKYAVV